jgi:hypothetical protein
MFDWMARSALVVFLLSMPVAAQVIEDEGRMKAVFLEAIDLLREQDRNVDVATARIERLKGILDYVKEALRQKTLTDEEREAFEVDRDYLEGQLELLTTYIKKDTREYQASIEEYLDGVRRNSRLVTGWERARRRAWKKGRPALRLRADPAGPVASNQGVLIWVEGLPRKSTVRWSASAGEIEPTHDPARPWEARWSLSRVGGLADVRAEVINDKLEYPVSLEIPIRVGEAPSDIAARYERDLAEMINIELGRLQNEADLEEVEDELRSLGRQRGVPDSVADEVRERRVRLREDIEIQEAWVEYIHAYALPWLADEDESGWAELWERQRMQLQDLYAPRGQRWAWHIEPGEHMSDDSWHFLVGSLPEGASVTWTLGADPTTAQEVAGDALVGVFVPPQRSTREILSARITIPGYTLPARADWILPATGGE